MNDLLRQAQMMQKKMAKMQEELNTKEVEASSGGGMVRVRANGSKEILEISIDPSVVDPEEISMLQDLILAATNEALKKAKEMVESEMSQLTGGMNIPGMF
ncbi:MAG: YbaB/EbfC family nucleoid-associated protein [Thermodesulfobacteriota bacterium]